MSAGLRAGLIGAAAAVVLSLLSLGCQSCSCATVLVSLILYVGVGVLAANWTDQPHRADSGAVAGAVAALITAGAGRVTNTLVGVLRWLIAREPRTDWGDYGTLPPEVIELLEKVGVDTAGVALILVFGTLCCVVDLVIAPVLGAIGGAVRASVQTNDEQD